MDTWFYFPNAVQKVYASNSSSVITEVTDAQRWSMSHQYVDVRGDLAPVFSGFLSSSQIKCPASKLRLPWRAKKLHTVCVIKETRLQQKRTIHLDIHVLITFSDSSKYVPHFNDDRTPFGSYFIDWTQGKVSRLNGTALHYKLSLPERNDGNDDNA